MVLGKCKIETFAALPTSWLDSSSPRLCFSSFFLLVLNLSCLSCLLGLVSCFLWGFKQRECFSRPLWPTLGHLSLGSHTSSRLCRPRHPPLSWWANIELTSQCEMCENVSMHRVRPLDTSTGRHHSFNWGEISSERERGRGESWHIAVLYFFVNWVEKYHHRHPNHLVGKKLGESGSCFFFSGDRGSADLSTFF